MNSRIQPTAPLLTHWPVLFSGSILLSTQQFPAIQATRFLCIHFDDATLTLVYYLHFFNHYTRFPAYIFIYEDPFALSETV